MRKLILSLLFATAIYAQTGGQGVGAPCDGRPQHVFVNATASGTTVVIPAPPHNQQEQIIRVCKIEFSSVAALNIKFVGTISAVDTAITATYPGVVTYSNDWRGQMGTDTVGPGASLGINLSGAGTVGVTVSYYYSIQ